MSRLLKVIVKWAVCFTKLRLGRTRWTPDRLKRAFQVFETAFTLFAFDNCGLEIKILCLACIVGPTQILCFQTGCITMILRKYRFVLNSLLDPLLSSWYSFQTSGFFDRSWSRESKYTIFDYALAEWEIYASRSPGSYCTPFSWIFKKTQDFQVFSFFWSRNWWWDVG